MGESRKICKAKGGLVQGFLCFLERGGDREGNEVLREDQRSVEDSSDEFVEGWAGQDFGYVYFGSEGGCCNDAHLFSFGE